MQRKIPFLIIIGIAAVAAAYMCITALSTPMRYYVTVSELAQMQAQQDIRAGQKFKVVGTVQPGSLTRATYEDPYNHFTLVEGDQRFFVAYRGPIPEQFQEGREVVVSATLAKENVLAATDLIVKCASKYQEMPKT